MTEAPRPDIDPYPLSPYVAWAGHRNKDPILEALKTLLPEQGDVLELATGAGLHVNYFAPHFPGLTFQPSDYDADVFDSIKAKRTEAGNGNVLDPIRIDLTDPGVERRRIKRGAVVQIDKDGVRVGLGVRQADRCDRIGAGGHPGGRAQRDIPGEFHPTALTIRAG